MKGLVAPFFVTQILSRRYYTIIPLFSALLSLWRLVQMNLFCDETTITNHILKPLHKLQRDCFGKL
ncbi:hypothetical protein PORCRE_1115 [Porphyromonas crevioricanis JCM 15906]|uniref:Uncharacterized protein n=1 Tax=Porphyromonas crevioricanis JCM 15906 TaxID=1305617 RepID=T1DSS8_9PORP|nr:hypothetical protein PORCRE_1115 [Porphyromonas crevioricanis JCM 15906]GAD07638.1 hypothetical protein PORCAN_1261 [Porphyromonas crevioricanis JCM 13913]